MTHDELVVRAVRWLKRSQRCKLALSETHTWGEIPDAIGWNCQDGSHLIECKTSRNDFTADKRKLWRRRHGLGLYRWYMTPPGLLRTNDLLACWGLLEVHPRQVRVVQRARQVPLGWWNYEAELWLLAKHAHLLDVKLNEALTSTEVTHETDTRLGPRH